jgi:hypothetical protein
MYLRFIKVTITKIRKPRVLAKLGLLSIIIQNFSVGSFIIPQSLLVELFVARSASRGGVEIW